MNSRVQFELAPLYLSTPMRTKATLPNGTVAILFTDIEGSTLLWERDGARMSKALAAHDMLARRAVEVRHGTVVKTTGDGMHAIFHDSLDALAATVDLQQALADPAATHGVALHIRCGLHVGAVELRDNDYFGSPVNRAARIMSAAHGGQVLLSQAVVDGLEEILPPAVSLRDLGKVRLKDLATPEHVYQVVHPNLRDAFPALRSLEATPNNLLQQATSFIGREQPVAELLELLAKMRMLTLTGSGGCGKTRLSLQVAADSLERFPDGAWLVELAPLVDPSLVPQTVATVLGLKEQPGKTIAQTLTIHLKDKKLLLLLDNCEHLLNGCAELADALLRHCPQVTILASSREALGIGGEQTYRVPSLSHPDPNHPHTAASIARFDAVQLFAERALLAQPHFKVSGENANTLASICCRLDGIPLAIELAAARVRSLSVAEIDGKLDQRFRLLTSGSRTAMPRQQTLRSLIDWSYDLLNSTEQRLLQKLSIFAGGCTLAAAEKICGDEGEVERDTLDVTTSLCDKSLVVVEENDEHYRYRLLETVRQYADEKLAASGGGNALRERHCDFFLALAEEAEPKLRSADQSLWLQRLEAEHENLRAGLAWALGDGEPARALRLGSALPRFWIARGHLAEGREWCARALGKPGTPTQDRAKVMFGAGQLAYFQSDYTAAIALNQKSLAIQRELGDLSGVAASLNSLGNVAYEQGNFDLAETQYEESLAVVRKLNDRWGIANSLNNLGSVALDKGDTASARALHEEALAIKREQGDRQGIAALLNNLGIAAYHQGDFTAARERAEESLAIKRELGNQWGMAASLSILGDVACEEGDAEAARAFHERALATRLELGDRGRIAYSLEGLAAIVALTGKSETAARIFGASERLREDVGSPLAPIERAHFGHRVAAARAAFADDATFDRAWQNGRALPLEQAIALALQEPRPK